MAMMTRDDGLKPCPFCGNVNVFAADCEYAKTLWVIRCGECRMEFTVRREMVNGRKVSNREALVRGWNKRDWKGVI